MKKPERILESPGGQLALPKEEWANLIVLAEDWGWKPEQRRLSYLASGTCISASDALNMSSSLETVLKAALDDPRSVYPLRARMEFVSQVAEFFREGEIRICE